MRIVYAVILLSTFTLVGCGEYKAEQPAEPDTSQQQGSDAKEAGSDSKDKPAEGSGY